MQIEKDEKAKFVKSLLKRQGSVFSWTNVRCTSKAIKETDDELAQKRYLDYSTIHFYCLLPSPFYRDIFASNNSSCHVEFCWIRYLKP